jgi:methionine aminopeptidase
MKKTKSGIIIKSEKDIEGIKKACLLSSEILDRITEYVKP